MVERESGVIEGEAPVAPPIPSFASLRSPQRRSAIDLLLPPAAEPVREAPAEPEAVLEPEVGPAVAATAQSRAPGRHRSSPAAPRPAEWGDLLALGTRLGSCAVRLVAGGWTGLRTRLRG